MTLYPGNRRDGITMQEGPLTQNRFFLSYVERYHQQGGTLEINQAPVL
jgi:hypothetical protein